ncbi:MAG: hypothetical protein FJX84_09390, partial [Bacteroidetes bacterium]|nr:hypothetical protein [Bacteroidota bacterium]
MRIDFKYKRLTELISAFHTNDYFFDTFHDFIKKNCVATNRKVVIFRHDVDALPKNSLAFARIQAELGIAGTYYFRMVPQSYNEAIIKEMVQLGHEVGYHYETMDTCKGDV